MIHHIMRKLLYDAGASGLDDATCSCKTCRRIALCQVTVRNRMQESKPFIASLSR